MRLDPDFALIAYGFPPALCGLPLAVFPGIRRGISAQSPGVLRQPGADQDVDRLPPSSWISTPPTIMLRPIQVAARISSPTTKWMTISDRKGEK